MQNQMNIRIIELLRFLYQQTDEAHPATVSDILAYLKERNISAVRQTVYAEQRSKLGTQKSDIQIPTSFFML